MLPSLRTSSVQRRRSPSPRPAPCSECEVCPSLSRGVVRYPHIHRHCDGRRTRCPLISYVPINYSTMQSSYLRFPVARYPSLSYVVTPHQSLPTPPLLLSRHQSRYQFLLRPIYNGCFRVLTLRSDFGSEVEKVLTSTQYIGRTLLKRRDTLNVSFRVRVFPQHP